jgi:cation:H+ antiporter
MNEPFFAWMQFLARATVITTAGAKLSGYGDVIADRTGISRTWVGLALMATATSMPELVTGLSAATAADAPNIAVGCGVVMIGFVGVSVLLSQKAGMLAYRHVGVYSPVFRALCLVAIRAVFQCEREQAMAGAATVTSRYPGSMALRQAIARFVVAAAILVAGS